MMGQKMEGLTTSLVAKGLPTFPVHLSFYNEQTKDISTVPELRSRYSKRERYTKLAPPTKTAVVLGPSH